MRFSKGFGLLACVVLIGCEEYQTGAPAPVHKSSAAIRDWDCSGTKVEAVGLAKLRRCPLDTSEWIVGMAGVYDVSATQPEVAEVAAKIMFAIDVRYEAFESGLLSNDRGLRFVPELVKLALPIAGVTESVEAVEYAAIDLLTNGYDLYQDKYLAGTTADLIVDRMRKDRQKTREVIEKNLQAAGYPKYPLSQALRDIQAYEQAGSIHTALRVIAEAQRNSEAESRVEAAN